MKIGNKDASIDAIDESRLGHINFERVANSNPVDITARLVASEGIHYDPTPQSMTLQNHWFNECPPLKIFDKEGGWTNLIGMKTGNLTCVGYFGKGLWIMRCACGRFKLKRARDIRLPRPRTHDSCAVCLNTENIRKGGYSAFIASRNVATK